MKKNSFYMVLPSNSCPKTQPNNVAGKFIVDVQNGINIDGDWEVALTEFSFTSIQNVLEKGLNIKYVANQKQTAALTYNLMNLKGIFVEGIGEITDAQVVDMAVEYGMNTVEDVNGKFKFSNSKNNEIEITFPSLDVAGKFGFLAEKVKGKELVGVKPYREDKDIEIQPLRITVFGNIEKTDTITLEDNIVLETNEKLVKDLLATFTPIFKQMLLVDNKVVFKLQDNILNIDIHPILAKVLGFNKTTFVKDATNQFEAVKPLKPTGGQNHMYIYMSVIEPILVGNTYTPLLKTIWLEHGKYKSGDVVSVTPRYPMYLPISSSSINSIEVNIRSDSGNIIDFGFGAKSVLTLHFRKK